MSQTDVPLSVATCVVAWSVRGLRTALASLTPPAIVRCRLGRLPAATGWSAADARDGGARRRPVARARVISNGVPAFRPGLPRCVTTRALTESRRPIARSDGRHRPPRHCMPSGHRICSLLFAHGGSASTRRGAPHVPRGPACSETESTVKIQGISQLDIIFAGLGSVCACRARPRTNEPVIYHSPTPLAGLILSSGRREEAAFTLSAATTSQREVSAAARHSRELTSRSDRRGQARICFLEAARSKPKIEAASSARATARRA